MQKGFTPTPESRYGSDGASHNRDLVWGFTLVELLVVIAIVAVLSMLVILTLNPAELLKQSRDSNRISDMSTLKSAVSLYLSDATTPVLVPGGAYDTCHMSVTPETPLCGVFSQFGAITQATGTVVQFVDGGGWLPVGFVQISSGAPFGNLPIDPMNNANFYYAYAAVSSSLVFEIDASGMESVKYGVNGDSDAVSADGGDNPTALEVGNAPSLSL